MPLSGNGLRISHRSDLMLLTSCLSALSTSATLSIPLSIPVLPHSHRSLLSSSFSFHTASYYSVERLDCVSRIYHSSYLRRVREDCYYVLPVTFPKRVNCRGFLVPLFAQSEQGCFGSLQCSGRICICTRNQKNTRGTYYSGSRKQKGGFRFHFLFCVMPPRYVP